LFACGLKVGQVQKSVALPVGKKSLNSLSSSFCSFEYSTLDVKDGSRGGGGSPSSWLGGGLRRLQLLGLIHVYDQAVVGRRRQLELDHTIVTRRQGVHYAQHIVLGVDLEKGTG